MLTGSIPPTGIPMPFISAGGTSLSVFMGAIVILCNVGNFILNKLWLLSAELDYAIIYGDFDKIRDVKIKYLTLTKDSRWVDKFLLDSESNLEDLQV